MTSKGLGLEIMGNPQLVHKPVDMERILPVILWQKK